MKISELKKSLQGGKALSELLSFRDGQECTIYKADTFRPDDTILYIPDVDLNEIPTDLPLNTDYSLLEVSNGKCGCMTAEEQIRMVLSYCYTGEMFVEICEGDEALAWRLFCYIDWQHPTSALDKVYYDDQDDAEWVKAAYQNARENLGIQFRG